MGFSKSILAQGGTPNALDVFVFPRLSVARGLPMTSFLLHVGPGECGSCPFPRCGGPVCLRRLRAAHATDDMLALRQAAEDGVGVVQLADYVVMDRVASSFRIFVPAGLLPLIFASRKR